MPVHMPLCSAKTTAALTAASANSSTTDRHEKDYPVSFRAHGSLSRFGSTATLADPTHLSSSMHQPFRTLFQQSRSKDLHGSRLSDFLSFHHTESLRHQAPPVRHHTLDHTKVTRSAELYSRHLEQTRSAPTKAEADRRLRQHVGFNTEEVEGKKRATFKLEEDDEENEAHTSEYLNESFQNPTVPMSPTNLINGENKSLNIFENSSSLGLVLRESRC